VDAGYKIARLCALNVVAQAKQEQLSTLNHQP
jgi:hypothetical protein